ncbi:potassium voltage-gated channel protein Shaw-like [Octopus sinensis]|uniref:Potassium voltage-gated channel protein Shaw-like n=1 Tax=Octopus sinensis TaxID=2607531 RepID=A0A7E6EVL3_9MOLL|nr:potassium voltage-gated channel protein Shaw-like [Octopus sinensis]
MEKERTLCTSLIPKVSMMPSRRFDNRIIINVSGIRYETYKSTLKNIPDTRLSWLTETTASNPDYDPVTDEFFFDRHPGVFSMILNYYRTGFLHVPTDVCGPLFENELNFWGLDEKQIEPCCWSNYRAHREAQQTVTELDNGDEDIHEDEVPNIFGISDDVSERTFWQNWKPKIWRIMEYPNSSIPAKIMEGISVFFVLMSIVSFTLESLEDFRVPVLHNSTLNVRQKIMKTNPLTVFKILEITCIAYFTFELVIRLIFCPNRLIFFKNFLNWIDVFSLIPFYLREIVDRFVGMKTEVSYYVNMLRLIRIFRILRLTRHVSGIRILAHTVKASAKELLLLIIVVFMGITIFACLIYYAQQIDETASNKFLNIPIGFWWALVTITTLGYGDYVPDTLLGYIIGAICSLCGVLMLALPVPVIVNNFTLYYSHAQAKLKLPKKTKKVLVGAADALKEMVFSEDQLSEKQESLSTSITSIYGKTSQDSAIDSTDSSSKTQTNSNEVVGIRVIYVDEVAEGTDENRANRKQSSKKNLEKRNSVHPLQERLEQTSDVTAHRLQQRSHSLGRRSSFFPRNLTDVE